MYMYIVRLHAHVRLPYNIIEYGGRVTNQVLVP